MRSRGSYILHARRKSRRQRLLWLLLLSSTSTYPVLLGEQEVFLLLSHLQTRRGGSRTRSIRDLDTVETDRRTARCWSDSRSGVNRI